MKLKQQSEVGASTLGNDGGRPSGSDSDFKVACIYNNIPPEPPTTTSLTVKKQVFGCDNIVPLGTFPLEAMDCSDFQNNSLAPWLDCNTNSKISDTIYCLSLPESIFDIEVLDDQNSQIQQFEGSEQGTTIPNLQPGTYTVNEIEQSEGNFDNQLADDFTKNVRCSDQEFPDGGLLIRLHHYCMESVLNIKTNKATTAVPLH